jgi:hypothetical protein
VKVGDLPGSAVLRTHIHEVHDLTVRGIEERYVEAAPVASTINGASGISFGLLQDVLGAYGYLLCFDDAQEPSLNEQGIICRASFGWIFLDCVMAEGSGLHSWVVTNDHPWLREGSQPGVDPLPTSFPLWL